MQAPVSQYVAHDAKTYRQPIARAFGLVLFVVFAVLVFTKPIAQDEGVFLTIGKYLNEGQVPYRDFFDHKPPAIYFLFASLFKIFGVHILVIKIALLASVLGSSLLVQKIGEVVQKGSGWYAAVFFLFLLTQFEGHFLIAEPFLLFPLLVALYVVLCHGHKQRFGVAAGCFLATAVLLKQTVVLSALPILFFVFRYQKKNILAFLAGLVTPVLLIAAYLAVHGVVGEAFHQVVTLTLTEYPRESLKEIIRFLANNFFWTLPLWVLFLLGIAGKAPHKKILWALVLLPLPFMFFRHYPHYWVQVLPFVALIAAVTLVEFGRRRVLSTAVVIFCLSVAAGKVAQDAAPNLQLLREQQRAADVIAGMPARRVLAENQFSAFFFLLPHRPLNKYLYLTEITEAENAEQQTLDDLAVHADVVVLWPHDPNYAYAKKIQKILEERYSEVMNFPLLGMRVMMPTPPTSQ